MAKLLRYNLVMFKKGFFSILVKFLFFSISYSIEFKPLKDVDVKGFYSSSKSFIPFSQGIDLNKKGNIFLYGNGGLEYNENLSINYTVRGRLDAEYLKFEIYKGYTFYKTDAFAFTIGKTSKNIGISQNSLILSENAPPFLLFDIETLKPIKFGGNWRFEILHGWLDEKRLDRSNTRIIITRADYTPSNVVTIGINRFEQYGGAGRPDYKIWEFPKLLIGSNDNLTNSKYDADGYFGFDINLNLNKYFKNLDSIKAYYQKIATDITAFWQKEDKGKFYFPFIIKLQGCAQQIGVEMKKGKNIFSLEFTTIHPLFYIHHLYNIEGYSYKNFGLGNPYGNNLWEIYFSQKHNYNKDNFLSYKLGLIKQPAYNYRTTIYPLKSKRYYIETEYSYTKKDITLSPYIRLEYSQNYDSDPLPMQYNINDANKFYFITGLSIKVSL